jgi:hypothetical protein
MDLANRKILMAAIEERRELVQTLWFLGHQEEGSLQYEGLLLLRERYKEGKDADTRLNHPRADGNTPED